MQFASAQACGYLFSSGSSGSSGFSARKRKMQWQRLPEAVTDIKFRCQLIHLRRRRPTDSERDGQRPAGATGWAGPGLLLLCRDAAHRDAHTRQHGRHSDIWSATHWARPPFPVGKLAGGGSWFYRRARGGAAMAAAHACIKLSRSSKVRCQSARPVANRRWMMAAPKAPKMPGAMR